MSQIILKENSLEEIHTIMENSKKAFESYQLVSSQKKAIFLDTIALNIEELGDDLIHKASEETNLPYGRLKVERDRTIFQLRTYSKMLAEGSWVEASIDHADPSRLPVPKADIRKMLIPIGPIVVFGASNFPFAYSTAGGDTASALATGCTVVVKAHPAHAQTSALVATAISDAAKKCDIDDEVFQHVHNPSFEAGKAMVQHSATAAVGFTGSYLGGKALLDYSSQRVNPIPIFAEMGSINPVIFFPDVLLKNGENLAIQYAASITASMGQFCTNPGLLLAIEGEVLDSFLIKLSNEIEKVLPEKMLHQGIKSSFNKLKEIAINQKGVHVLTKNVETNGLVAAPILAKVKAGEFLNQHALHEEVFGPYSLMVVCKNADELKAVYTALKGQLTTTLNGTSKDFEEFTDILKIAPQICGRVIYNGVPTGVEVCYSMVHGGPFPATSDSRFTAVGALASKRWLRPVCFQNCPDALLPEALQNGNPLKIWRTIDSILCKN